MDYLLELASAVQPGKLRYVDLLGKKKDQVQQLYDGIRTGRFSSETEARSYLFSDSPHRKRYFRRIKRALKERLINSLLCIRMDERVSEAQAAYIECHKKLSVMRILRSQGKRKSAIIIAEEAIKRSLEFHFTDLSLAFAKELQIHYAAIEGNMKKYQTYARLVREYSSIQRYEELAQHYSCEITHYFTQSKSPRPRLIQQVKAYMEELLAILEHTASYWLALLTYNLAVIYYQMINDHDNIIRTCQRAISYFESLPFSVPAGGIRSFLYKMIPAYIFTGHYEKAESIIEQAIPLAVVGGHNWVVIHQYRLILGFHSGKFRIAYETLEKVKGFAGNEAIREQWKIYEAYVQFFMETGKIDGLNGMQKFRIGKFLNEVPTFSRDKQGMNINILIVQILFLLQQQKYGAIIDRIDALTNYSSRYLRKDGTFRSNCFIKLLLLLPANNFNCTAVKRKALPWLDKLQSMPTKNAHQDPDLEIVPYEKLWEEVLALLE